MKTTQGLAGQGVGRGDLFMASTVVVVLLVSTCCRGCNCGVCHRCGIMVPSYCYRGVVMVLLFCPRGIVVGSGVAVSSCFHRFIVVVSQWFHHVLVVISSVMSSFGVSRWCRCDLIVLSS